MDLPKDVIQRIAFFAHDVGDVLRLACCCRASARALDAGFWRLFAVHRGLALAWERTRRPAARWTPGLDRFVAEAERTLESVHYADEPVLCGGSDPVDGGTFSLQRVLAGVDAMEAGWRTHVAWPCPGRRADVP